MLVKIPLLAFLVFGVTYPLFLCLHALDPIKHNFHRFHLGCPVIIAGLAVAGSFLLPLPMVLKAAGVLWVLFGLGVTAFYWNKEAAGPAAVLLLCLSGMVFYYFFYGNVVAHDAVGVLVGLLSGFIVSAIFYAMNLGHFYLNVHGLNIIHLRNAVLAFGLFLVGRLVWNVYYMIDGTLMYGGEEMAVWRFMNSMDGFLLWMAFFFGTLFPLGGLYFAFGTLKLKNTQATTGILYVLLSAVLLGDLAYKYYAFKFGVPM